MDWKKICDKCEHMYIINNTRFCKSAKSVNEYCSHRIQRCGKMKKSRKK